MPQIVTVPALKFKALGLDALADVFGVAIAGSTGLVKFVDHKYRVPLGTKNGICQKAGPGLVSFPACKRQIRPITDHYAIASSSHRLLVESGGVPQTCSHGAFLLHVFVAAAVAARFWAQKNQHTKDKWADW